MTDFAFAWGYLEKAAAPTEDEFRNIVKIVKGFDYQYVDT